MGQPREEGVPPPRPTPPRAPRAPGGSLVHDLLPRDPLLGHWPVPSSRGTLGSL